MTVEELEEPMTPPQHISPDGLATPEQVADRSLCLVGHVDGGQLAGTEETAELDGIAAIRLDALAGSPRRQRGSHHRTRDPACGDLPVKIVTRDAGLVWTVLERLVASARQQSQQETPRCVAPLLTGPDPSARPLPAVAATARPGGEALHSRA
jgi:hypothetical protein